MKLTPVIYKWLESCRESSVVVSERAKLSKKSRPPWVGRLVSLFVDIGISSVMFLPVTTLFTFGIRQHGAALLLFSVPVYYFLVERLFGRSLGKIFMGYKLRVSSARSAKRLLLLRSILRFLPGVNLFLMLSWRRVTLLDLLSGTSVLKSKPADKTERGKSRGDRASRTRGFDPALLQR